MDPGSMISNRKKKKKAKKKGKRKRFADPDLRRVCHRNNGTIGGDDDVIVSNALKSDPLPTEQGPLSSLLPPDKVMTPVCSGSGECAAIDNGASWSVGNDADDGEASH
jgi:hypothetical protein